MEDEVDVWRVAKGDAAHGGAGLSVMCWLGGRGVFAAGDEDGKIGLWKVQDLLGEAGTPVVATKAKEKKKPEEITAYKLEFPEVFSKHTSLALLRKMDKAQRGKIVAEHHIPDVTEESGDEAVMQAIISNPAARPVPPAGIEILSYVKGAVQFTVTPATHATYSALQRASEDPELTATLDLTEPISYKRLKCISWCKEHVLRVKITALASNTAGDRLFSASLDCAIKIWKVQNALELRHTVLMQNPVYGLATNSDGSLLACTDTSGALLLYPDDVEGEGETIMSHKKCHRVGTVKTRSLSSADVKGKAHVTRCTSVAVSGDGEHVAAVVKVGGKTSLTVWGVGDGGVVFSQVLERVKGECLLEFLGGDILAVRLGCVDSFVFKVTRDGVTREGAGAMPVSMLSSHPGGKFVFSGQIDASLGVISIAKQLKRPSKHKVPSLSTCAVHPSGEFVAVGTSKGQLQLLHCNKMVESFSENLGRQDTQLSQHFPTMTQFDSFSMQTQNLDILKNANDSQLLDFPHTSSDYIGVEDGRLDTLINGKRKADEVGEEGDEPEPKKKN